MGKVSAVVNDKESAKTIVDGMVNGAVEWIQKTNGYLVSQGRL